MTHGQPHILVVHHIPADDEYEADVDYEIEHLPTCSHEEHQIDIGFPSVWEWTCELGWTISYSGLDGLNIDVDIEGYVAPEDDRWGLYAWKGLPDGRYVIRAWHSHDSYSGEYDGGLEFLGREGEVDERSAA